MNTENSLSPDTLSEVRARLTYTRACERVGWQGFNRTLPRWEKLPDREREAYTACCDLLYAIDHKGDPT